MDLMMYSDDGEATKTWNAIYSSMSLEEKIAWNKSKLEEKKEAEIQKKIKEYRARVDLDKHKKIENFEKRIRSARQQGFLNKDSNIKTEIVVPAKIEEQKTIVPDALYTIKNEPIISVQTLKNKPIFKEEGIAHPDVLAINKALYGQDF
jgi:hypothetical protein